YCSSLYTRSLYDILVSTNNKSTTETYTLSLHDALPIFQGLPARICWIGLKDRARIARAFNDMVRRGELSAPIVIGRDHLDSGSVASPNRETESMLDGSDAVSDWPLLNALLNTASGATWVSLHHGGGVGMGYS